MILASVVHNVLEPVLVMFLKWYRGMGVKLAKLLLLLVLKIVLVVKGAKLLARLTS
jgi:hypothetical protein